MQRALLILLALSLTACSRGRAGGSGGDDDDSADDDDATGDDDDATGDDDDATSWPDDAFLGFARGEQENNMTEQFGYMTDLWVRVGDGGLEETRSYAIPFGAYLPGPNGVPEGGANDDELLGLVPGASVAGDLTDWEATIEPNTYPQNGYPSAHLPEGAPPEVVDGVLIGHADAGTGQLEFSEPTLGSFSTLVMVVPPDWCPFGEHDGGAGNDGFCE